MMLKPSIEPKDLHEGMQAEFQMWGYDFKRISQILEAVSLGFMELASNPNYALTTTYALKEFYSSIRFLLLPRTQVELDQRFKDTLAFVKQELASYFRYKDMGRDRQFNPEVYEKLDRLRDDLMTWRQILGLGIPAQKRISKKKRLKGAMTGE